MEKRNKEDEEQDQRKDSMMIQKQMYLLLTYKYWRVVNY